MTRKYSNCVVIIVGIGEKKITKCIITDIGFAWFLESMRKSYETA